MSLNITGLKPVDTSKSRMKVLIYGEPGSGKTRLASTIADQGAKTLFLDFVGEHGTASFAGAPYAKNIDVYQVDTVEALDKVYYHLKSGKHDYDALVVDSLTAMQNYAERFAQGFQETSIKEISRGTQTQSSFQVWGKSNMVMTEVAKFFSDLASPSNVRPIDVVFIAHATAKTNDISNEVERTIAVQSGARAGILASMDYVLFTEVIPNMEGDPEVDPSQHIVRFGAHPGYVTKARVPQDKLGNIPPILGLKSPLSLTKLGGALGIIRKADTAKNTKK